MAFYYHPIFVALFLSSPVWLIIAGTIIRTKFGGKETRLGRLGMAMQFLSQITLIVDIILATAGPSAWPIFFSTLWALGWLFLLLSCVAGTVFGKDTFAFMADTKNEDFGIGNFWGILAASVCTVGVIYGILWLGWTVINHFIGLFNNISTLG